MIGCRQPFCPVCRARTSESFQCGRFGATYWVIWVGFGAHTRTCAPPPLPPAAGAPPRPPVGAAPCALTAAVFAIAIAEKATPTATTNFIDACMGSDSFRLEVGQAGGRSQHPSNLRPTDR